MGHRTWQCRVDRWLADDRLSWHQRAGAASWRVHDITGQIYPCDGERPHTVRIGTTNRVTWGCPPLESPLVSDELADYLVIRSGAIAPDNADSATINRRVSPTSSAGIELTLGRDGRIDAAILASVRRVSP
ncbi:MAG TPA: hypothetical protein VGI86_20500 [Acidimicrobiia bacterium]|jgi:hypothetical protein